MNTPRKIWHNTTKDKYDIWSFVEMIQFLSKHSLHIYLANIQYIVPQTETRCSDQPSKRNTFHFILILNI